MWYPCDQSEAVLWILQSPSNLGHRLERHAVVSTRDAQRNKPNYGLIPYVTVVRRGIARADENRCRMILCYNKFHFAPKIITIGLLKVSRCTNGSYRTCRTSVAASIDIVGKWKHFKNMQKHSLMTLRARAKSG